MAQTSAALSTGTYLIEDNRNTNTTTGADYLFVSGVNVVTGAQMSNAPIFNFISQGTPSGTLGAFLIQAPSGNYLRQSTVSGNTIVTADATSAAAATVFDLVDCSVSNTYPGRVGLYSAASASPWAAAGSNPYWSVNAPTYVPTGIGTYNNGSTTCATTGISWEGFFLQNTATTPTALARGGWTVSAQNPTAASGGANLFDQNTGTRWTTGKAQAVGQSFTVNMGASKTFTQMTMDSTGSSGDYARGFTLGVSTNGTSFTTVGTFTGSSNTVTATFASQTAQYIQITLTQAVTTNWFSVDELNVFSLGNTVVCGSGVCEPGETCTSCPQDCGQCQPICGNGVCEKSETCSNCASDCGSCGAVCGNGVCQAGETAQNCPQDCGCSTSALLNTTAATSASSNPPTTGATTVTAASNGVTTTAAYSGNNYAWQAFDHNAGTRWETVQGATADPSYITYDFGSPVTINGVTVQWETASAKNYEIDVANLDPATNAMPVASSGLWTKLGGASNLPAGANRVDQWFVSTGNPNYSSTLGALTGTLNQGTARFLRIYATQRTTGYGYSIWEVSVYGSSGSCGAPNPPADAGVADSGNGAGDGAVAPYCGDGVCQTANGEGCLTCSKDCGNCSGGRSISSNLVASANDGTNGSVSYQACSEGGQDLWNVNAGSFVEWYINVPTGGNYVITTRSSATATASYNVLIDGTQEATVSVPSTNGAQVWESVNSPSINIASGKHTLQIQFTSANQSLEYVQIATAACTPSCGGKCGGSNGCGGTCANTCTGSQTCDITTQTCIATGGCTMDSQCTGGQVCGHAGACMNVAALTKSAKRGLPFHFCGWNNALGNLDSRGAADLHDVMSTKNGAFPGGISWYYNWSAAPLSCNNSIGNDSGNSVANDPNINNFADGTNGVEFVPMVWGFAYGKQLYANDPSLGLPVVQSGATAGTYNLTTVNALPASTTFPSGFAAGTPYNCSDANGDNIPDGPCFRVDNDRGDNYCSLPGSGPGGSTACPANATTAQNLPGGSCYECWHEVIDYGTLLNRIPPGSKYLLCGNEPMFLQQSALPPEDFAQMWHYCEQVASARGLKLVAPAANYVGPYLKGNGGAGEGIPVLSSRQNATTCTSAGTNTSTTVQANTDCPIGWGCAIPSGSNSGVCQKEYQFLDYLDNFYHECEAGKHGRAGSGAYSSPGVGNCLANYNAIHVYTGGWNDTWAITSSVPSWTGHTDPSMYDWINTDTYVASQAANSFWITEFSPDYAGSEANLLPWMNADLDTFETSPLVFRYSWFQIRIADAMTSINLNSIACATTDPSTGNPTSTLTNAGQCYMSHPANAVNNSADAPGPAFSPSCAAQPLQTANCCDQNYYGLCVNGMVQSCTTNAQCFDSNYVCSNGICAPKGCAHDSDCNKTDSNFIAPNGKATTVSYVCDGITWTDSTCSTVKYQGGCKPAKSTPANLSTASQLNTGNSPSTCPQPGSN